MKTITLSSSVDLTTYEDILDCLPYHTWSAIVDALDAKKKITVEYIKVRYDGDGALVPEVTVVKFL